jgi:hypothetical protein
VVGPKLPAVGRNPLLPVMAIALLGWWILMAPARAGRTRTTAANERLNILDWVLERETWNDVVWIVELGTRSTEESTSKTGALLSKPEGGYQPAGGPRNSTVGKNL